jgi:competence protein ComEA
MKTFFSKMISWANEYYVFTSGEVRAIIVLTLIIISVWTIPLFFKSNVMDQSEIYRLEKYFKDTIAFNNVGEKSKTTIFQLKKTNLEKHGKFNPNNMTIQDWKLLGVPAFIANRIVRYKEKGGRFYSANDLLKIYGFDKHIYISVEPYLKFETKIENYYEPHQYSLHPKVIKTLELNIADSLQLDNLPGIGPIFAKRIINYRKLLGGF